MSKSPDNAGRRGKQYASAAEALQGAIADGQTLAVGGFGLCGIPEALIAALRDTLAWGKTHRQEVVSLLQKNANLPPRDAEVYFSRWDSMNRVTFEPADIATLKRQHQVFVASGTVKGDVPESLYDDAAYKASASLK